MYRYPWKQVDWSNSVFLISTFLITVTAVPAYIWHFGVDWFMAGLFLTFFIATGLSITLGYHRLFSHLSFKAKWPVRLATLLFGAAAFENSALRWTADHRRHHKHTDHDEDPYDITKGFFHAHIGWILFRINERTPLTWVKDLQKDELVVWQHKYYLPVAILVGFVLPTVLGGLWNGATGALGGFLIAGVARVVFVHHMTFFINSLCHMVGKRPYSTKCTARDSGFMALFTFGEGYHNFHHEFQHDYRNGAKAWQFDPTKWSIWLLSRLGLADDLRMVAKEKIMLTELAEKRRQFDARLESNAISLSESAQQLLESAQSRLQQAMKNWEERMAEYRKAAGKQVEASKEKLAEIRRELRAAKKRLRVAIQEWKDAHKSVQLQFQFA
ncbi:MAG: stearoyl-CoA desaturase (delta-9 desaturase) [Limisphaerales bacterium]|jgi:stearoyl-CoA desaturase (delta-9 desaturase)